MAAQDAQVPVPEPGEAAGEAAPGKTAEGEASATAGAGETAAGIEAVPLVAPPEGVDWANRWAELENAFAALEAERDTLKADVVQLRKEKVEKAMESLSPKQAVVADRDVEELKTRSSKAEEQAEARLAQVVEERNRVSKLSQDLETKTASLSNLSQEKLQLQYELNTATSKLLPVQQERDRLSQALQEAEKISEELRTEAAAASQEKNKLFKEKQELKRELTTQVEAAQQESKYHQDVAEEAREGQQAARKQTFDAERRLRDQAEAFAEERAAIETKLALKGEQLQRANELREAGVAQLQFAKEELEGAEAREAKQSAAASEQAARAAELEEKLGKLQRDYEELLRRRIPGAATMTAAPEGFASLSELVTEVTAARADALKAKQDKEQMQDALAMVERDIRVRYPVLEQQCKENVRLRGVAAQLTRQNEGLLQEVQQYEREKRGAEAHAKQAKRSAQILEEHARDMGKQLGVLVVKNQRLSGRAPVRPPGITDLEALESDRKYWHNVQDLVTQNEHLKKSVRRLGEECETAAQKELTAERQAHEEQAKAWEEHLAAKADQMKALVDNIERLTHERDAAQRALRERPALPVTAAPAPAIAGPATAEAPPAVASGSSGGTVKGPLTARGDLVPREHLAAVREEFTKATQALHLETKELRDAGLQARQELATAQAKLDFEVQRSKDLESSRGQMEKRLEERRSRVETLEKRVAVLEAGLGREEETARNLEASLGQAHRDKGQLDMQLKLERSKVAGLEHSNASLVAEKASHAQHNVDLQTRMTQQAEAYNGMKSDLETSYKKAQELLEQQLGHAEQRQKDLEQTVKDINDARSKFETEAANARARSLELETFVTRLETQLAERTFERDELRAALPARLRRGADVAAEAEAQLELSQAGPEKAADVLKLEQKVRFADEREKKHAEDVKVWKAAIARHETDLKTGQERATQLEEELKGLREQQSKHDELADKARQKELTLEAQSFEHAKTAAELQVQLEKKEAEVTAMKLDRDEKVQKARSELEAIEHQTADARENLEDWKSKHREAVQAHAKDINELDGIKEKCKHVEAEVKELRQQNSDLAVDNQQARTQRADELETLRKRAEEAEKHSEALGAESKAYQERLLAFAEQSAGGPNADMEKIAVEMRRARELGELQRQELELDRARLERETKGLREEVVELQKRLDKEQDSALQLQAEVRRQQRGVAKLAQLGMIEDENRRLTEELKSVQDRFDEASKELQAQKQQLEPLQLCKREMTRKEEVWERAGKEKEAVIAEWKQCYDILVQKFDSLDVKELKTLREQKAKWQTDQVELNSKVDKAMEELKKLRTIKQNTDDLTKNLTDSQTKLAEAEKRVQDFKIRMGQAVDQKGALEAKVKQADAHRQLRDNKITDLEKQVKELTNEIAKGKQEVAKSQEDQAELKKNLDKASVDVKKGGEEAARRQVVQKEKEDLEKQLSEALAKCTQERVQRSQLLDKLKEKDKEIQNAQGLKELHVKRLEQAEQRLEAATQEVAKCKADAARKMEEDLAVRERADKALSLAMDYKRGCEALVTRNSAIETRSVELEERMARDRKKQEAAKALLEVTASVPEPPSVSAVTSGGAPASIGSDVAVKPVVETPAASSVAAAAVEVVTEAAKPAESIPRLGEAAANLSSTAGAASNPFSLGAATATAIFSAPPQEVASATPSLVGDSPSVPAASTAPGPASASGTQGAVKRKISAETSSMAQPGDTSPTSVSSAATAAEPGPSKTARTTPPAGAGVDPKGSPAPTPAPKKAPIAAKIAPNPEVGAGEAASDAKAVGDEALAEGATSAPEAGTAAAAPVAPASVAVVDVEDVSMESAPPATAPK